MQYAVLLSSIVLLASIILSQPSTLGLPTRIYSTPSHGSMPLDCVATPDFSFHRFASNWTSGSQEGLTTELFSPAPVHRSHPFTFTIKPEPATVILRPVVLALPTGRADGRIYHFTKPLELQNFPWARRNAHVECVRRIELPLSDWKSEVLPLNYTHMFPIAKLPSLEHRNL